MDDTGGFADETGQVRGLQPMFNGVQQKNALRLGMNVWETK